jgi:DNA-damage-inducible protein J
MANATIQIRTETQVKETADLIFKRLGITMSDAINIFLRQVNQYGDFPFDVKPENTNAQLGHDEPQKKSFEDFMSFPRKKLPPDFDYKKELLEAIDARFGSVD